MLGLMQDWPLLCQLAESHPEWSFVFVGPIATHAEITDAVDRLRRRRWLLTLRIVRPLGCPSSSPCHPCLEDFEAVGRTCRRAGSGRSGRADAPGGRGSSVQTGRVG